LGKNLLTGIRRNAMREIARVTAASRVFAVDR
jgi:hypothetical protein